MPSKEEVFKTALSGKQIPILTLDHKWHRLFGQEERTPQIRNLENRLNELVKRQGKLNTESKDIKKIKKKLMDEIVMIADKLLQIPDSMKLSRDMDEHKRLINECNEKLEGYEEELSKMPREIDRVNKELMTLSMDICYKKIQENDKEIQALDEWIKQTRRELKKKVIRKEEEEEYNHQMYAYMHDIFGADVIEIFDRKYNLEATGEKTKQGKRKKSAPES